MAERGLYDKDTLARRYGITVSTIDYYIEKKLLQPIQLDAGLFFSASDLLRLEIIARAKRLGFNLGEIQRLIADYSAPSQ